MIKHKWFIASLLANIVLIVFLGLVVFKSNYIHLTPQTTLKTQVEPKNKALESWIEKLADHEGCPITGLLDNNGKYSYGDLCFQKDTFVYFVKKYNMLPYAEENEYMNWIGDGQFQRELTYRILTDSWSNYVHWKVTVRKIGTPPKVL